jgi:multiple sugar transport system substrate-binding protein
MKKYALILMLILAVIALMQRPGFRLQGNAPTAEGERRVSWIVPLDLSREIYEETLADFRAQHPDIVVEPIWVPGSQYHTKFKTLVAAGIPPDVFYCGDVWVAYLRPFLLDLSPYVERDREAMDFDDFYPRLRQATFFEGKSYFLPRNFNISLLYYNKGLFDAAEIAYPQADWTWDDYLQAGKALSATHVDGKPVYGSTIMAGWWGEWLTMVRQCGGRMFDADIQNCLLDQPEALQAMKFYADKIELGISPPPGKGPSRGFESGRYGMVWGGHTGNWSVYNQIEDLDWDIEMLPIGPAGRAGAELSMDAYGISKDCEDPEAAWAFVKFLCSTDSLERFAEAGSLVARRSVAEKVLMSEDSVRRPQNIRAVYDSLEHAMSIPQSPDFIELAIEVIQPEIDLLTAEGLPVETVCRRAAESANAFIKTMGVEAKK